MSRIFVPPTTLGVDPSIIVNVRAVSPEWYYDHWFIQPDGRPRVDKYGCLLTGEYGVESAIVLGVPLIEVDIDE